MNRWYYIGDKKRLSPCENRDGRGECTLDIVDKGLICPGEVDKICWCGGSKSEPHPTTDFKDVFSLTAPKVVIRPLRNPRKPKPKPKPEKSEFGMGTTYCLGLFLKHAERDMKPYADIAVGLWFNGASDHLYDMKIPKASKCNATLRVRLEQFRDKCLHWGHGFDPANRPTESDKDWAVNEACELLREIDKMILKVKVDSAQHT